MPLLVLSGKHVFLSIFGAIGKKAASHRTPRRQVPRREDESDVVHHCVLTANDLFFFLAAQAIKLSLSASLEWAEKSIKRHPRANDYAAAIQILEFFLCLGSISCFPSRFADRAGGKNLLDTARISFEEPTQEYAVL